MFFRAFKKFLKCDKLKTNCDKLYFSFILQGDYGGPLLNKKGKVVGIAVPSPKAAGRSPSFFLKMSIYKYKIMQWVQELNEIKNHKISYYKHQPVTDE